MTTLRLVGKGVYPLFDTAMRRGLGMHDDLARHRVAMSVCTARSLPSPPPAAPRPAAVTLSARISPLPRSPASAAALSGPAQPDNPPSPSRDTTPRQHRNWHTRQVFCFYGFIELLLNGRQLTSQPGSAAAAAAPPPAATAAEPACSGGTEGHAKELVPLLRVDMRARSSSPHRPLAPPGEAAAAADSEAVWWPRIVLASALFLQALATSGAPPLPPLPPLPPCRRAWAVPGRLPVCGHSS